MRKLTPAKSKEKIDPKAILLNSKLAAELESEGVVMFRPVEDGGSLHINTDYLTLPANITDVPAHIIGEYLNAFTQQKLYMRTLLGEVQCLVEEARRMYDSAAIGIYRTLSEQRLSETAKEKIVNADLKVLPFFEQVTEARIKQGIIEQNIDNITDAIFLISREMTRRIGDFKDENRNENVRRS